jgi:hypothetical protein
MIVLNADNPYRSHFSPVQTAVRFTWDGVICRLEDQPMPSLQPDGQLPFAISFQLLAVGLGKAMHYIERISITQFIQSSSQLIRKLLGPFPSGCLSVAAQTPQFVSPEQYLHGSSRLSDVVNLER